MTKAYTHFIDLAKEAQPPDDGILSRTLYNDDHVKTVIFGFAAGEERSEHTASTPAILHFISGETTVILGDELVEAQPQTWIHMPAELKHSIKAKSPIVMLLLLLK
jgi:quercetin dioxygenase-like cupin family protein